MFEETYSITIDSSAIDSKTDPSAARAYEAGVRRNLSKILHTASGRILLNSIRYDAAHFRSGVKIVPYDGSQGPCNSDVETEVNAGIMSATVLFSPGTWDRSGPCGRILRDNTRNRATLPDEVLFHELVHALRTLAQISQMPTLAGGLYRYDDFDEFCAVLATNIHISDRTNRAKTGLSADHHSGRPLETQLARSFEFFQSSLTTFEWVARFCRENPGFTKALAGVRADFNPFWAYYHDPGKARKMSLAPLAEQRDSVGFGLQADDYEKRFFANLAQERRPTAP